jgi:hypothetical protein
MVSLAAHTDPNNAGVTINRLIKSINTRNFIYYSSSTTTAYSASATTIPRPQKAGVLSEYSFAREVPDF